MWAFINATLPWVAVGISIIMLVSTHNRRKETNTAKAKQQEEPDQEITGLL